MRKKGIKWPTLITDPMMSLVIVGLITLGTIAVTSTTVFIAQRQYHDLFYFARNHFIHLVIACMAFLGARRVPFRRWEKLRGIFLILSSVLRPLSSSVLFQLSVSYALRV